MDPRNSFARQFGDQGSVSRTMCVIHFKCDVDICALLFPLGERESDDSDSESVDQDEDEDIVEVENPRPPRWTTPHPTMHSGLARNISYDTMSPLQYFKVFFCEDILQVIVGHSNVSVPT